MSKVEELLLKLCPRGVTYRRVDEICNRHSGLPLTAGQMRLLNSSSGDVRIFAGGQTIADVDAGSIDGKFIDGPGLIVKSRGIIDFEFWHGRYSHKNELWSYKPKDDGINLKFLYYFFKTKVLEVQLTAKANSVKMPQIKVGDIDSMLVPVPPIEVQIEIVRILDTFIELEAELEAELKVRKSQYEYFSNSLLDMSDTESQHVAVSDICRISRGTVISKDYLRDHPGSFPVYSSQTLNNGIFGCIDTFAYDFESLTWTTDGANAGSIFFHQNEKFTITNVCGLLQVQDPTRVSTRFLYYVLSAEAPKHVSAGMGNPKLMAGTMGDIKIKLPSLEKQEEIVAILDKFDGLVNGATEGLPAEIAARRTQYEYYRSKLLVFKKMEAA